MNLFPEMTKIFLLGIAIIIITIIIIIIMTTIVIIIIIIINITVVVIIIIVMSFVWLSLFGPNFNSVVSVGLYNTLLLISDK